MTKITLNAINDTMEEVPSKVSKISTLSKNTLDSKRQAFFQYYTAENIAEIFTELL